MKKHFILPLAILAIALTLGCQKEEAGAPGDPAVEVRANNNSYAFPKTAHPYGKSITQWSQDWWAFMFSYGCDDFPILDEDGSNAVPSTEGPVIFLPGNFGGDTERTITVPHGKALLFPIVNVLWSYHPCFEYPEEDEWYANGTLEENILAIFNSIFSQGVDLSVTLDGYSFTNLTNYRHTSGLYNFDPNDELADCFGPCLAEPDIIFLTDGYWIMLKPLQRGQHTLNFAGVVPAAPLELDITYNITVE